MSACTYSCSIGSRWTWGSAGADWTSGTWVSFNSLSTSASLVSLLSLWSCKDVIHVKGRVDLHCASSSMCIYTCRSHCMLVNKIYTHQAMLFHNIYICT